MASKTLFRIPALLVIVALCAWVLSTAFLSDDGFTASATKDSGQANGDAPKTEIVKELVSTGERRPLEASQGEDMGTANPARLSVRGRVRSSAGDPIEAARVQIGGETSVTKPDGTFLVSLSREDHEDSKRLMIRASARGFTARQLHRSMQEISDIEITMEQAVTVLGKVVDADAVGIPGAEVWAMRNMWNAVRTDEEGLFRVELDAAIPQHYLQARAPQFIGSGIVIQTDAVDAQELLKITLKPGSGVYGIVVESSSAASSPVVEGAVLQITGGRTKQARKTQSDSKGYFAFTGTEPGKQTLTVRHGSYALAQLEIEVPPVGESLNLRVELSPGETISGLVQSANGDPLAKADIIIREEAYVLSRVTTDESGAFETNALPIGTNLRLQCRASGHETPDWARVEAGQRDLLLVMNPSLGIAGTVVRENGDPVQAFEVRILPAGPAESGKGKGRAGAGKKGAGAGKGGAGAGKRGAGAGKRGAGAGKKRAGAGKKGAYAKSGGFGRPWHQRFVNPEGHFEISWEGLEAGARFTIEVTAEDLAAKVVDGLEPRQSPAYADHRIMMDTGATLTCLVLASDGEPLANAKVSMIPADTVVQLDGFAKQNFDSVTTSEQGLVTFSYLRQGDIRLHIKSSSSKLFLHAFTIPAGATQWQETIRVHSQGSLRGTVFDTAGNPNPEAWVQLSTVEVPGVATFNTRRAKATAEGSFEFSDLPIGVYRVGILLDSPTKGGKPLENISRYVNIVGQEPRTVRLALDGVASIVGTSSTESGSLASGIIRLQPIGDVAEDWEKRRLERYGNGRNGAFKIESVALGRYRLTTWWRGSNGWLNGSREIEVTKSGETNVGNIEVQQGAGK